MSSLNLFSISIISKSFSYFRLIYYFFLSYFFSSNNILYSCFNFSILIFNILLSFLLLMKSLNYHIFDANYKILHLQNFFRCLLSLFSRLIISSFNDTIFKYHINLEFFFLSLYFCFIFSYSKIIFILINLYIIFRNHVFKVHIFRNSFI